MNTAVAPLLDSNLLEDMARGPQQATKSSFTVENILQRPSTLHTYPHGEIPNAGEISRQMSGISEMYAEERARLASASSVHAGDFGQDNGQHYSNGYFPGQFVESDQNIPAEQRSPFEDSHTPYLPESHREGCLAFNETRFQNIGASNPHAPSGKRVHSVESIPETSASPSPSTLPPSPGISVSTHQNYFPSKSLEKSYSEKNLSENLQKHQFAQNGTESGVYTMPSPTDNKDKYSSNIADLSSSYSQLASTPPESQPNFESTEQLHQVSGWFEYI